jgi:hypothetical protein
MAASIRERKRGEVVVAVDMKILGQKGKERRTSTLGLKQLRIKMGTFPF